jgi:hypothetical protein
VENLEQKGELMRNWSIWNGKRLWCKLEDLEHTVTLMKAGESGMQSSAGIAFVSADAHTFLLLGNLLVFQEEIVSQAPKSEICEGFEEASSGQILLLLLHLLLLLLILMLMLMPMPFCFFANC